MAFAEDADLLIFQDAMIWDENFDMRVGRTKQHHSKWNRKHDETKDGRAVGDAVQRIRCGTANAR